MKNENTNIYVIYKFSMGEAVDSRLEEIKKENNNIIFFKFDYQNNQKNRRWKKIAKKKMNMSNLVLFFYDNEALAESKNIKSIKWELELAKKLKRKIITIYSKDNNEIKEYIKDFIVGNERIQEDEKIASELFGFDYSGKSIINKSYKECDFKKGKEKVLEYSNWSMENLFTGELSEDNEVELRKEYYEILLKQYEIMIQTSENLIERRGIMSDKFKTLCITLISLVTASIALNNLLVIGVAFLFVGIILAIISHSWTASLIEYSKNNEGKFAVINAIEEKLPAKMFDYEYTFNKYKGIKTYSYREQTLPKVFAIIGIFFFFVGIIVIGFGIFTAVTTQSFDIKSLLELFVKE